jgi:lipopolysaccharide export LptBFGC system permease protein LptF
LNGEQLENRLRREGEVAYDTGCYIVVQTAVGAGEDEKFFAQIEDVSRERRKSKKKDSKKQDFSFPTQNRSNHTYSFPAIHTKISRINSHVKNNSVSGNNIQERLFLTSLYFLFITPSLRKRLGCLPNIEGDET